MRIGLDETLVGRATRERRPLTVEDLREAERILLEEARLALLEPSLPA